VRRRDSSVRAILVDGIGLTRRPLPDLRQRPRGPRNIGASSDTRPIVTAQRREMAALLKRVVTGTNVQATETRDSSHIAAKKITPMRVLVIDGDRLMRWAVVETLRERGWQVSEGADARDAEAALRNTSGPFDFVLLDCQLLDSDDLSLLASVRALSPDSKVIMMTAFETPDMVRDALDLGASSVLGKPFDMETVHTLVGQVQ